MSEFAHTREKFLATRGGFWVAMVVLGFVAVLAASEFRRYAISILEVRNLVQEHQSVGSHATLNEISRLNWLIVRTALNENNARLSTSEVKDRLISLRGRVDLMRKDSVRRNFLATATGPLANQLTAQGNAAVLSSDRLIGLVEAAINGVNPETRLKSR